MITIKITTSGNRLDKHNGNNFSWEMIQAISKIISKSINNFLIKLKRLQDNLWQNENM